MSYTLRDALLEAEEMFEEALHSDDPEFIATVAKRLAKVEGWEEDAETLRLQARRIADDEMAYDRSISN